MTPKTLYQKICDSHVVHEQHGHPAILYIQRHLLHDGTSPHALANTRLVPPSPKTRHTPVHGKRPKGVTAKDLILAILGKTGIAGGNGHVAEYGGEAIRALSMDGRMTGCTMTIEGGARAGMIAPDETTFAYLEGRPFVPKGKAVQEALDRWRQFRSDDRA